MGTPNQRCCGARRLIPRAQITEWAARAPWPTEADVEQDLVLSRLMVQIANDELLRDELAIRGGTCLHKLHLPQPLRYSEDLDYVRRTHSGIAADLPAARFYLCESLRDQYLKHVLQTPSDDAGYSLAADGNAAELGALAAANLEESDLTLVLDVIDRESAELGQAHARTEQDLDRKSCPARRCGCE
jgi:hypothetical protein